MTEIIFIEGENFDLNSREVFFHAQLPRQNDLVRCRVPAELLRDRFGAPPNAKRDELLAAFSRHRRDIELVAERLIQAEKYETDRTILIRSQVLAN